MKKIVMMMLGVMMLVGANTMIAGRAMADTTICSDSNASEDMKELAGCNVDKNNNFDTVVNKGLNVVLMAVGIIAVGVMVYGGFVYITSQGDPSKTKRGKDVILYGLIGVAVALLAFMIVNFVVANIPNPR